MFVDFLSLLLLNMVAGYVLLSLYVYRGLDDPLNRRWTAGFLMVGLVAFLFGGYITMTWPLPGAYNSLFGEFSVMFGIIFLGAAAAIANGWSLLPVTVFAFFAGIGAVVSGAAIIHLHLTAKPLMTGGGYFLSGLAGVFSAPTLYWFRGNRGFRCVAALWLLTAAAVWALTVYMEYWLHPGPEMFGKWIPLVMRGMPPVK
jgi:putative membrane protein